MILQEFTKRGFTLTWAVCCGRMVGIQVGLSIVLSKNAAFIDSQILCVKAFRES